MLHLMTKNNERIKNRYYIEEYAEIYGKKLLTIKSNLLEKAKKTECKVEIENETAKKRNCPTEHNRINNKDYFDVVLNGKRTQTVARYSEKAKAYVKIKKKKNYKRLMS